MRQGKREKQGIKKSGGGRIACGLGKQKEVEIKYFNSAARH